MRDVSNKLVYHFSPAPTFFEIIRSGKIWASDATCLNDNEELSFAHLITEIVEKIVSVDQMKPYQDDFLARVLALKEKLVYYVFCTCNDKNNLTAWRSYANEFEGFALAFDQFIGSELTEAQRLPLGFCNMPITYVNKREKTELSEIKEFIQIVNRSSNVRQRLISCASLIAGLKSDQFRPEDEYRFVFYHSEPRFIDCCIYDEVAKIYAYNTKFRQKSMGGKREHVAYMELGLQDAKLPIKEIVMPPKHLWHLLASHFPRHANVFEGLRAFLDDNGYSYVPITFAETSFTR